MVSNYWKNGFRCDSREYRRGSILSSAKDVTIIYRNWRRLFGFGFVLLAFCLLTVDTQAQVTSGTAIGSITDSTLLPPTRL